MKWNLRRARHLASGFRGNPMRNAAMRIAATLDTTRRPEDMSSFPDPATLAVRAALESDSQHGAVVPPLHLSSNYTFAGFGEKRRYDYCRSGNPTRDALGDALTVLEGGAGCTVTSSGMAAL